MSPSENAVAIERIEVAVYTIPTDRPESDGTLEWTKTTLVTVHIQAGGRRGFGYTYADRATATVVEQVLSEVLLGKNAMDIPALWTTMIAWVRNLGRPGIASTAIAAVDAALWDLKAKLLGQPLALLLGMARPRVPIYGSGGFTSYTVTELCAQLAGWVEAGIPRVKMKVGRDSVADPSRVEAARQAIGPHAELFVDANGAYARKEALARARTFADLSVHWFEEPVSSDDLVGLAWLREQGPPGMDIAAGEYGYSLSYFAHMLEHGSVDVLQSDASRCGITGFLGAAVLAEAYGVGFSAHCAPSLHLHAGCAVHRFRHLEFFYDHVRIERMLFDGFREPKDGSLEPDLSRPGIGVELKTSDARTFAN
jgi:L-alanine-DL-glutamate epimerase-like enolase superfamily enzyme